MLPLSRAAWNPTCSVTTRRCCPSDIFSGRGGQHHLSRPVWPCGGDPGRFRRLGIWRVGASAISAARRTAGRGVAEQDRLAWHPTNLCWCASGKRWTTAGFEAARSRSRPRGSGPYFMNGRATTTYLPRREEDTRCVNRMRAALEPRILVLCPLTRE